MKSGRDLGCFKSNGVVDSLGWSVAALTVMYRFGVAKGLRRIANTRRLIAWALPSTFKYMGHETDVKSFDQSLLALPPASLKTRRSM